jgi:acyl-CoA hydrolase
MATYQESPMSTSPAAERFVALPDDETLAETVAGLKARGFGVEVVDNPDAARRAVLARIPHGSSVMNFASVTLDDTGIAQAIDDGGPYDSARSKALALDRATQSRELKAIMGQPDFALGSVHAITRDGTLVIASALGNQLAAYAFGADSVIFVVGAQKLVPDLAAAHERIHEHCLALEDARAMEAYGVHSRVGKILEIHEEDPGRIHVVLIRRRVGF